MFSGLTNQVSSWMGAAKGEPHDEDVPTPTREAAAAAAAAEAATAGDDRDKQSPTKAGGAGSKLDIITNVKSQMTGWLGQGIPIPGLRKGEAPPPPPPPPADADAAAAAGAHDAHADAKDDDDNSRYNSATGGADSRPGSAGGTPTDDQPAGGAAVGNGSETKKYFSVDVIEVPDMHELTTKAVAGAKSLGSFLYSAVNKAGAKVSEAGAKIKKTVEENSILGELSREQEAFVRSQGSGAAAAQAPWAGAPNEAALKDECLALATDRRNFVRAPPAGVEFAFDYDHMYPVAVAIMQEDPNLEKMRFDLVPKVITEENFWRNYFYRLSLICQANEADAAAAAQAQAQPDEHYQGEACLPPRTPQESIDDAKQRIRSLRADDDDDEQWERELESELREYEVVAGAGGGGGGGAGREERWERECEALLAGDGGGGCEGPAPPPRPH